MKLRLVYSPTYLPGNPLFGVPVPVKPRIVPFLLSVAGHILTIAALMSFARFNLHYDENLAQKAHEEHYISVMLGDPKLIDPPKPSGAESGATSAGAKGPESPKHSGAEERPRVAAIGEGKPKNLRQFQFEVPDLPKIKRSEHQTILEPDLPPDLAIQSDIHLPTEIFLTPTAKIKPPTKQFVAPLRRKTLAAGQGVTAPVLDTPNFEVKASDLKVADRIWNREARLPKPAGTTTPVRVNIFEDNLPQLTASTPQKGDPLNLISIPDRPLPPVKGFVVPQGNEVAASAGAGTGTAGTSIGSAGTSNGVSTGAPGVSSDSRSTGTSDAGGGGKGADRGDGVGGKLAGTGNGNGPDNATGTGGGGNGTGFGRGNAVAGSGAGFGPGVGTGKGTGTTGTGLGAGAGGTGGTGNGTGGSTVGSSLPSGPGIKTISRPHDGTYEVVIVQSSSASVPGTSGILTGKPVYTVYLQVDGPKDWILQYCLPHEDNGPRSSANVVKLGNPAPLKAPYPYLMIRPAAALAMEVRYLIVHGFVGPTGKFERLAIVGESDPAKQTMLGLLQQWEFRPALKDGQPVTVEVLLVIPKEAA